jgi:hypothetical protein
MISEKAADVIIHDAAWQLDYELDR